MPLTRYGVLIGVLDDHYRDQPDTQGRWYHVNLRVTAQDAVYRCAVDVDSKQSNVGVQWKLLTLPSGKVNALAAGYHDLAHQPDSGALDYVRQPELAGGADGPGWISGSNLDAALAFEPILVGGRRALIFGEPFTQGLGMHNVHQNQGDPAGGQWWDENGVWQDGGTMTERPDGTLDVFISKFSTQATSTDAAGHPI